MSRRTETKMVETEASVYFCDHCGRRIGEAPIAEHGGYFVACSVAPGDDERPLWSATLCWACMDALRRMTPSEEDAE